LARSTSPGKFRVVRDQVLEVWTPDCNDSLQVRQSITALTSVRIASRQIGAVAEVQLLESTTSPSQEIRFEPRAIGKLPPNCFDYKRF